MAFAFALNLMALCMIAVIGVFIANLVRMLKERAPLIEMAHLGLIAAISIPAVLFFFQFHFIGWQAP